MRSALEAVSVIEAASIARGFVMLDALVKKAPVTVRAARPVSPGKLVVVFGGDVDSTLESHKHALEVIGSCVIDELFLPGAHPALLAAIDATIAPKEGESVGLVETTTVAASVLAADIALKAVDVAVPRMHLALGIGGKGWFAITGALPDVTAALDAVKEGVREDRVVAIELIPQPHGEVRGFFT
jgi:microcompartment protein CcmL/EutN